MAREPLRRSHPALVPAGNLPAAGIFTGIAIVLHNIPEGLATFVGALSDAKVQLASPSAEPCHLQLR